MSFRCSSISNDELIHDAVRQGHVISLEIYLSQTPNCINKLYTYNQSIWTILLAACYYKHANIVRMLLNRFKPDIEATGTISFDLSYNQNEIVENVSPLWTAAAVDDFDIVRLLIEQGHANINHLTKTQSTTFRVACYNNNLEMAKYLVEKGANPFQAKIGNYTNLMLGAGRRYLNIVRYLIEDLNSNINEQDENGQTALYYAIKSGSEDIVRYLLQNGAMNLCDKLRKVTPLMRAALYGEINLIELFRGYCTILEWIEARELLAATFGGCVARLENFNSTIQYLSEAFQLRKENNVPKIILNENLEIFNFEGECQTIEEFEELIHSESASKEKLRIETIRIHQRILGDASNDYHHVLRYYGAVLADSYKYHDCLRWWFYEIDLKLKHNIPFKKDHLRYFVHIFIEMKYRHNVPIPIDSFIRIFNVIDRELQTNTQPDSFDYNLHSLMYLITLVAHILFQTDKVNLQDVSLNECSNLLQSIRTIIRHRYKTNKDGSYLIHLCSNSLTPGVLSVISYPCILTIRLLIICEESIDAFDFNKNTPLHIVIQNISRTNKIEAFNIISKYGAHSDYVNSNGLRPIELIPSYHCDITDYLKVKLGVKKLKCICAQFISQKSLIYKNYLSQSLSDFLEKH